MNTLVLVLAALSLYLVYFLVRGRDRGLTAVYRYEEHGGHVDTLEPRGIKLFYAHTTWVPGTIPVFQGTFQGVINGKTSQRMLSKGSINELIHSGFTVDNAMKPLFYAFEYQREGTIPVYRRRRPDTYDHLTTTNEAEGDKDGYRTEQVFYAYPI